MKINTISLTKTAFASLLLSVSASIATADTFETQGNDVLSVAKQKGSFNTLAKAIEIAGLQDALTAQGPVTIFAPTDEAFAKLPAGELEALLKPENKDKLVKLLTHHVVPGKALETEDMKRSRGATTVGGDDVKFELVRGRLRVDGANSRQVLQSAATGQALLADVTCAINSALASVVDVSVTDRYSGAVVALDLAQAVGRDRAAGRYRGQAQGGPAGEVGEVEAQVVLRRGGREEEGRRKGSVGAAGRPPTDANRTLDRPRPHFSPSPCSGPG